MAARLVGLEGRAGVVAPGAFADLLVVDGNPLERLEVLTDPARHLRLVMAAGRIHTNSLACHPVPARYPDPPWRVPGGERSRPGAEGAPGRPQP